MGGAQPVAPATPDPAVVAMLQGVQQQDLAQTQSDLSGRDSAFQQAFGVSSIVRPSGASTVGGLNGLSSVAFAPLGMSSPVAVAGR